MMFKFQLEVLSPEFALIHRAMALRPILTARPVATVAVPEIWRRRTAVNTASSRSGSA